MNGIHSAWDFEKKKEIYYTSLLTKWRVNDFPPSYNDGGIQSVHECHSTRVFIARHSCTVGLKTEVLDLQWFINEKAITMGFMSLPEEKGPRHNGGLGRVEKYQIIDYSCTRTVI